MRKGDILVYRIKPSVRRNDGTKDTGHIFVSMGRPRFSKETKCRSDGKTYKRYKLRIADATKYTHYPSDTRTDGNCPGNCGIGQGEIYLYADSAGKLKAIANGFSKKEYLCPPSRNVERHEYAIGRLTE